MMNWSSRLLVILVFCFLPQMAGAGIVNNSGTTAEDSLAIVFQALDSIGSPVDMASGDSVYLAVFYPSGALAFRDSMAFNNARITTADWEDWNGAQVYTFRDAVANIDGAGLNGTYKYCLLVDDNTAASLVTPHWGEFQLVTHQDFAATLDSVLQALDYTNNTHEVLRQVASTVALVAGLADTVRDVIGDTLNVIGGAVLIAGVEKGIIADSVWSDWVSTHTNDSTFGGAFTTGTGGGAIKVNLDSASGNLSNAQIDDDVDVNVFTWLDGATQPNALQSGRVDAYVGAAAANIFNATTLHGNAAAKIADSVWEDRIAEHTKDSVFGGAYGYVPAGTRAFAVTDLDSAVGALSDAKIATLTVDTVGQGTQIWSHGTKILTAGTNIALAKGVGVTGFNDIAAADVWTATGGDSVLQALDYTNNTHEVVRQVASTVALVAGLADTVRDVLGDTVDAVSGKLWTDAGDSIRAHAPHANNWGGTAASSLDSGTVSRVVARRVYGIAAGAAGSSDSTIAADRKIGSAFGAVGSVAGLADTMRDVVGDTFNVISGGVLLAARGSDADTGIAAIKTKLTTIAGYTDDIGAAGAGLTGIPLNLDIATGTLSDAQIDLLTVTLPSDSLILILTRLAALLTDTSQALSANDSALVSRIVGRKVWGLETSGSDSSTLAQRTVFVDSVQAFAINAAAIAPDAIGSSELASTAVDEIWDETIGPTGNNTMPARSALGALVHIDGAVADSSTNTTTRFRVGADFEGWGDNAFNGMAISFASNLGGDTSWSWQTRRITKYEGDADGAAIASFITIDRPVLASILSDGSYPTIPRVGTAIFIMAQYDSSSGVVSVAGLADTMRDVIGDTLDAVGGKVYVAFVDGLADTLRDVLGDTVDAVSGKLLTDAGDSIRAHAPHGNNWASTGASACNGSGIVSCTLDVRNAAGGLDRTWIELYNSSDAPVGIADISDANGFVYFSLAASTVYRIKAFPPAGSAHDSLPYQTLRTYAADTAHIRDTVPVTTTVITAPAAANLKRVYIYQYDGPHPLPGYKLNAQLKAPIDSTALPFDTSTGTVYAYGVPVTDTGQVSNVNGYAHLDLTRNNFIQPAGTTWQIWITKGSQIIWGPYEMSLTTTAANCVQNILGLGACP